MESVVAAGVEVEVAVHMGPPLELGNTVEVDTHV